MYRPDRRLHAGCRRSPWLALQPDFQYIIHPGGLISRPNAVVIGLRSEIDF
jgi:carbohydrate-selective porin OprB